MRRLTFAALLLAGCANILGVDEIDSLPDPPSGSIDVPDTSPPQRDANVDASDDADANDDADG